MTPEWIFAFVTVLLGGLLWQSLRSDTTSSATTWTTSEALIAEFAAIESLLTDIAVRCGVPTHRVGGLFVSAVPVSSWTLAIELYRTGQMSRKSYREFVQLRSIRNALMQTEESLVSSRDVTSCIALLQRLQREFGEVLLRPHYSAMQPA